MTTADIFSMDYSALTDLAKEVASMNEEFQTMVTDLDQLAESLDGQWKGKAQVEFAAAYDKLKPKLNKISEVMKNYAAALNNAVTSEQELESSNKTLYNPITNPYPSF